MTARLGLSVYAVLDPDRCRGRPLGEMATAAARGGASLLQLRAKAASTRRFLEIAEDVRRAVAPFALPLVINDRVDVAFAARCAGVHLGAEDMPPEEARRLLGPGAIIGATVRCAADVEALSVQVVDYASVGGVFATPSKNNPDPPIGLEGFRELRRRLGKRAPGLPVCAIAGMGHRNAGTVIAAGADGVAVISDIFMADDVTTATRRLRRAVDAAVAEMSQ